jgi:uncharacterized protein
MPLTAKAEAIVQPVSVAERMEVLDVLRGIAIYGILLVNIGALSGSEFLTPAQHSALPLSRADSVLEFLLEWLVAQKFYSLFSFLFGVGFAVFVSRASARGSEPARLFKRRLAGLAIIGLVHTTLIWMGDILLTYALIGFALIPFLHRDDRTVLRWATMWLIAPIPLYLVVFGLAWFLPAPPPTGSLPPVLVGAVDAFAHGRYLDVVRGNLIFSVANAIRRLVLMFFPRVFGMFLLGFYVGRRNVFGSVAQHRPLFQRVLIWGFGMGLPLSFVAAALGDSGNPRFPTGLELLHMTVQTIAVPSLALGYAAAISLMFHRRPRLLRHVAPVGRMALSNYLLHSICGVMVFYGIGLGLWGRASFFVLMVAATAVVAIQMVVSRWWLSRAAFGPAEWIWRTMTYGRRVQLMR